jgi:hypothetical protein
MLGYIDSGRRSILCMYCVEVMLGATITLNQMTPYVRD